MQRRLRVTGGPKDSYSTERWRHPKVLDSVRLDPATVWRRWSVVLERTLRELQGTLCVGLEDSPVPKKEIVSTRSFGRPIAELVDLIEAVTEFGSRAAVKLRKQSGLANQVLCFIRTSPFRDDAQFSWSINLPLRRPSADTSVIVSGAVAGLRLIYRPGFQLAKAGVMLLHLTDDTVLQHDCDFLDDSRSDRSSLMDTLDGLNLRYGGGTVLLASAGLKGEDRAWSMKQER